MLKYQLKDDDLNQVFETISTAYEAANYILDNVDHTSVVKQMTNQMDLMVQQLIGFLQDRLGRQSNCPVLVLLKCLQTSVLRVHMNVNCVEWARGKIQFEILPILEEAYHYSYYWFYASRGPEQMQEYVEQLPALCSNPYICEAERTGHYKYDVAFYILAYNNLHYTKLCVESLLKNIPKGLNYELILVNHGSTDQTQQYFEHIRPTKQVDLAVNGAGFHIANRVVEAKYMLGISNDVMVGANAIENLLTCIQSDDKISYVVPTTPNISNFQTIPASYKNMEEMEAFFLDNNHSDPFRWEQRTRLCDPIAILRTSYYLGANGLFPNRVFGDGSFLAFPDDRSSLYARRRGYKLYLAKDAYCHHFGSATIQPEIQKKKQQELYLEGRKAFFRDFGIDPWGTGFCFDKIFLNCVIRESHQHQRILGINCGMGSNSLKIKEQFKEYYHNVDVELINITDQQVFLPDLCGISDQAYSITSIEEFKNCIPCGNFDYVVWEDSFLPQLEFLSVLREILATLKQDGVLILKENKENQNFLLSYSQCHMEDGWYILNNLKQEMATIPAQ